MFNIFQFFIKKVKTGVGGGICQLANLLYWMALHTPLIVTERHHHSFDPFPDSGRTLPFGSGIWRKTINKITGQMLKEELLIKNFSEVKYPIPLAPELT
ncbi:VanW family protein [Lysinibacillus xylanilyticus]|uniref:VanW family protein n=1 Tax=Lysinibacillus xylanilyticus TaxID=582475 RepID=UPI0037F16065